MTTADLAALLAGIDLNTARRRPRYSRPGTPPQNSEKYCANTPARVNVVEGMITLADPLPDDLETAHQLIRELLKTLAQQAHLNEKLQHQLEQLLRQLYGPKTERIDPGQLLLFAREILAQAEPAPTTRRGHPSRSRHDSARAQEEWPRPQAAAGEPAPQAGRPRRPARTTRLPRLRHRADLHRPGGPRAARIRPRVAGRARARPPQVRLPGLPGPRRDRRAAPRADREGPARPGAAGPRRRQQVCRSPAALSPRGDLPAGSASSCRGRRCATGWPSPPSCSAPIVELDARA